MKIREEHLYHGAALNQIAEHKRFTAINALKVKSNVSRSAFRINDSTAVYLKYASKPSKGAYKEYQFTFASPHLNELRVIAESGEELYVVLVCVKDKEICCITYEEFDQLLAARKKAAGKAESQFVVLITVEPRKAFRVYVNSPGARGKLLNPKLKIPRNRFPENVVK